MKISHERINAVFTAWQENPSHQRFGQYFCNHFSIIDPELFYEIDTKEALNKIYDKYLEDDRI